MQQTNASNYNQFDTTQQKKRHKYLPNRHQRRQHPPQLYSHLLALLGRRCTCYVFEPVQVQGVQL